MPSSDIDQAVPPMQSPGHHPRGQPSGPYLVAYTQQGLVIWEHWHLHEINPLCDLSCLLHFIHGSYNKEGVSSNKIDALSLFIN